jgi:hypothetical protein
LLNSEPNTMTPSSRGSPSEHSFVIGLAMRMAAPNSESHSSGSQWLCQTVPGPS